MKKIVVVFVCLLSVLNGYGQLSWNAKAGMNLSKITGYGKVDMKPGYQFGVGMDYYFTEHWGIQPSLMLISKGVKDRGPIHRDGYPVPPGSDYGYGDLYGYGLNARYNSSQDRIYLQMPLMLAYRFNLSNAMKFVINGGGYISYGMGGKWKFETTLVYFDDAFDYGSLIDNPTVRTNGSSFSELTHKFDAGLGAGTGLEIKNRYTISLFAQWGLKNTYKPVIQQSIIKETNQSYGLNIGYKF
jgi:hypothetical protein